MAMTACLTFAVLVNVITSVWVFIGRRWSFTTLANAMFFPTLLCPFFVDSCLTFLLQVMGYGQMLPSLTYSFVAFGFVLFSIGACVLLDLLAGWGTWIKARNEGEFLRSVLSFGWRGIIRAAGEEIGWRCFLLPCLMSNFPPFYALLISGITWGLFHVAIMLLLVRRLRPPKPHVTVLVQALCVTIFAYPHAWVSVKAGYSIWPSTVMHAVWNRVNPEVLGSIYTQTPGRLSGQQWLINGEGLAGCLVGLPIALLVVWDLC